MTFGPSRDPIVEIRAVSGPAKGILGANRKPKRLPQIPGAGGYVYIIP